jgi:hypothetical protein
MPTFHSIRLESQTSDDTQDVTLTVRYELRFSPLERFLAGVGLTFSERITVQGLDLRETEEGSLEFAVNETLAFFPRQTIDVASGTGPLSVQRVRSRTFSRSSLQEDPSPPSDDEIACTITVEPVGLPVIESARTGRINLRG